MTGYEDVGPRLEWAIKKARMTKTGFAERMEDLGVRGGQYRTLVNDLKGRTRPSLRYLEAAAHVLGVNALWLGHGEGRPDGDDPVRVDAVRWRRGDDQETERHIEAGFGALIGRDWPAWPLALELRRRLWVHRLIWGPRGDDVQPDNTDIATAVGRAMAAPLEALSIDPNVMSERVRQNYLTSILPVILQLFDESVGGPNEEE